MSMTRSSMSAGTILRSQGRSKCTSSLDCENSVLFTNFNRFPCVLPFSQMYPLCCIDIRNFLNQFYFFANEDFSHPHMIDDTLKDVSHTSPKT
jgi:hypothetical protein